MPRITFLPLGSTVEVAAGTSLFDAGAKIAANIETACVGKGTCGLCRVRVIQGEAALSPYSEEEIRHIGNIYHLSKIRLACRTKAIADDDIEVEVIARRKPGANPRVRLG